jgi:hypothetical protein
MRTERYELRDDPCSAGKRGGIGMVRVNRFLIDTIVTCEGSGTTPTRPGYLSYTTASTRRW